MAELINQIVDEGAIKSQRDNTLKAIDDIIKGIERASTAAAGIGKSVGGAASIKEVNDAIRQEEKLMHDLMKSTSSVYRETVKLQQAKQESQRKTKQEVQASNELIGSYKRLEAAAQIATRRARDLAVELGVNSKQALAAAKEANNLNSALKRIDASMNLHQRNVGNYPNVVNKIGGAFRSLAASVLSFISINSFFTFMKSSISEAKTAEQNYAKLAAVIRSTGSAAGVSALEMQKLATELQAATGIEDDAIINGQALLLTFTKIGKEVMPQAVESMLDMSKTLGTDVSAAAIQLGKALNDPVKGITALRRAGVQMTEQQQDQIKAFVKSGDILSAQKIILGEIKTQMGGVAQAMAQTDSGKIKSISIAFGELKEALGARWQKDVASASGWLNKLMRDAKGFIEIKMSETLKDQTARVNALTLALSDSNLPAGERNKIYNELKEIAPEIVAGIDAESINLAALTKNLAEFNKQAINRITIAMAYEDVTDAQEDAADAQLDYGRKVVNLLNSLSKATKDLQGDYKSMAVTAKELYQKGTINIYEYADAVIKAADAQQLIVESGGASEKVSLLLTYMVRSLDKAQTNLSQSTKESAGKLKDYQQVAEALGITIDDVQQYLGNAKVEMKDMVHQRK